GDRLRLDAARIGRIAHRPDAFLAALDSQFAIERELVLDVKAGAAELDAGLDDDVVAKSRRLEKSCAGINHRVAGKRVMLEELVFGQAERALEQLRGRGIEDREIARIEDDTCRIAIAPFDAQRARVA